MSLSRSLLLRLSRSRWVAEQFRRRAFARRAVRRFMPGEELSAALDAARHFASEGLGTVLTNLGERTNTREEALAVRDHYLGVLESARDPSLPTQISVKPTHLGLDIDAEECATSILRLAERARETGSFVWIDMEESSYVDATLQLYRTVRAKTETIGLCLQSYLRRTPADLQSLLPLSPAIRLVKGAYREPAGIAFPKKRDTDSAYAELARLLLERASEGGALPVFGTHDLRLLRQLQETARSYALAPGTWEIHMLYGIREQEQHRLSRDGASVRVLISYGPNWFPWYVRRLAERPANVWFVIRNAFGG